MAFKKNEFRTNVSQWGKLDKFKPALNDIDETIKLIQNSPETKLNKYILHYAKEMAAEYIKFEKHDSLISQSEIEKIRRGLELAYIAVCDPYSPGLTQDMETFIPLLRQECPDLGRPSSILTKFAGAMTSMLGGALMIISLPLALYATLLTGGNPIAGIGTLLSCFTLGMVVQAAGQNIYSAGNRKGFAGAACRFFEELKHERDMNPTGVAAASRNAAALQNSAATTDYQLQPVYVMTNPLYAQPSSEVNTAASVYQDGEPSPLRPVFVATNH